MKDLEKDIRNYALHNAVKFNGKASPGTVIGKLLGKNPNLKSEIKAHSKMIAQIVSEVNRIPVKDQLKELKENAPGLLEERPREKRKGLPKLPNAKKRVVMRFEPSPSGPLHIGHLYTMGLNLEYTHLHKGTFFLRIADTNPDNIYPEAYEMIPENAHWLAGHDRHQVTIQSDRMEVYYNRALRLIEEEHMYVCTCDAEEFKRYKEEKVECPCRNLEVKEQTERWHKMFDKEDGFNEGDAVVRFKTDIKHKNPAMRDFPTLRINDTEHARHGFEYRVWPLMNFSVAIDDMDMEITHTLRAKDHADNAKKQAFIHEAFGHKTPTAINVGRINFIGFPVSSTKTREDIDEGKFEGWDDVRIPFVPALKRRGYQPEAFRKYAVEVGVTANDKSVKIEDFFKTINAFNKELLEEKADRYFFINDPIEVRIEGAPQQTIELDLHPDKRKGGRILHTDELFYIQKDDLEKIRDNHLARLMDCLNFRKSGDKLTFDSKDYRTFKEKGTPIIHWLPKEHVVKVEVLMPDNSVLKGFGEPHIDVLDVGQIIQFERFGFCLLEKIEKEAYRFVFCHK